MKHNVIYLSFRSCDSCRRLPEPKHHSFLFNYWSASKCLVFMAARTPSIHVFLGRPLFLLSPGIHSIINFGSLSSCILLTCPYHITLCDAIFFYFSVRKLVKFTEEIQFSVVITASSSLGFKVCRTSCCIVDGYCCCVVDRQCFFLQDCGMYCM